MLNGATKRGWRKKDIFLIGSTIGVGKTTTCQVIKKKLHISVFLDGDWCWDMHPFQVAEETKQKVIRNNCFVLNNFIMCSAYEYIIFCWVMHDRCIIGDLLSHLNTEECRVHLISLVCDKKALQSRLRKDVDAGNRAEDIIDKSVDRISFYDGLDTYKDDVSRIAPEQAAELIIQRL